MSLLEKNWEKYIRAALFLLLLLQFGLIAVSNLTLIKNSLDTDTARMFNHIAEIRRQGTIFLPEWDYQSVSTLEWDCSSLFALPIYALTHRLFLSYGLSNILFVGIFTGIVFFLFREEDSLYPLLCLNLILIPYRTGMLDYYDMLFFGGAQYIVKVSVPLLLEALISNLEKEAPGNGKMPRAVSLFTAVYLGLLFLTSVSSGIYVTASGIFPLLAVYLVYKFVKWEKIPPKILLLAASSVILVLAGRFFNQAIMGGAKGDRMIFCTVPQLFANAYSCFFGMFELFGGATLDLVPILSLDGLVLLAKCCLVILMLVCGLLTAAKCIRKMPSGLSVPELRGLLVVSVFIWNVFILLLTDTKAGSMTYEYRYHLIGMVPLLCVTGTFQADCPRKLSSAQQNILYGAGFCAVLFLCVMSHKVVFTQAKNHSDLETLCAYIDGYTQEYALDYIYMYQSSRDSELCRVLAGNPFYLCLLQEGTTCAYDYYKYYAGGPMQTENVIVVVDDREYEIGEDFEIAGHHLEKFDSVAHRSLYYFID